MPAIFDRIGRPNAFSWPVAAIAVVPSIVLVLAGPWARSGGSPLPWVGIAVVAHGAATLAMIPLRATVLRAAGRPSRPVLTLAAFAAAGIIRGVVIGQLAYLDGLLATPETGRRLVSGALAGIVYLSIIALMVQSVRDHADSTRRLAAERTRLIAAAASAQAELRRVSAEIVERVRSQMIGRLTQTIAGLEGQGSHMADGAKAVAHLIDSTLKPLVDDITARSVDPQPAMADAGTEVVESGESLFSDTTTVRPINPVVTATALTLAGTVSFIPLVGFPRMMLGAVIVFVGVVATFRLSMFVMRPASRLLGPLGRALMLTLLFELSGLITTVAVLSSWKAVGLELEPATHASLLAASPLVVVLVGWGIAVTAAWNRRADEVDSEIAAAVESLKSQEASLRRELAIERDRLARFVHGPVQDRLIAAWGLLERGDEGPAGDRALGEAAALVDEAIGLLEERIAAAAGSEDPAPGIEDLIDGYAQVWEGLVEISCRVEADARTALLGDPRAARAVGEVVREGIANAARHARSERVDVSIECGEPGAVVVSVEAEARAGEAPVPPGHEGGGNPRRRGLGSGTLDQLTSRWQLEQLDSGSRLTAVVNTSV